MLFWDEILTNEMTRWDEDFRGDKNYRRKIVCWTVWARWMTDSGLVGVRASIGSVLSESCSAPAGTAVTHALAPVSAPLCLKMFGPHLHGDASAGGATIRLIWLTEAALCKVLNGNFRTWKIEWFKYYNYKIWDDFVSTFMVNNIQIYRYYCGFLGS